MTSSFLISLLISFTAFALMPACAKKGQSEPHAIVHSVPPRTIPSSNILDARLIDGEEPNRYSIRLAWQVEDRTGPTYIQRNGGTAGVTRIETTNNTSARLTDTNVTAGTAYEYLLCADRAGGAEVLSRRTVSIPRDAVVGSFEDIERAEGITVNRLFFTPNAVITLGGRSKRLVANEIIADNAVLQTFAMNQRATTGANGRNAGELSISARRARGRLRVVSRGEIGGDGVEGTNGANGAQGAPGTAGQWGLNPEFQRYTTSGPQSYLENANGFYTTHPEERFWNMQLAPGIYAFVCRVRPTNGAPGAPGANGMDGGTGGDGGKTAHVHVSIAEPSDFEVEISEEPGTGGIGGRGGRGGGGGPGGLPGAVDVGRRCAPASAGPAGAAGRDGRQGNPGARGTREAVCVRIGERARGECERFGTP